ncbi:hypothetical protein PproGo58_20380 [Pseudomonas protegens]|nr:hypothetical protein PproGo58_20380 [Pseudomonas protegens]
MMGPGTSVRGFKHRPHTLYVTRNPDIPEPCRSRLKALRTALAGRQASPRAGTVSAGTLLRIG